MSSKLKRYFPKHLASFTQRVWHGFSPWQKRGCKLVLFIGMLGLGIRLLPYLAPIRAQDLVQDDRAYEFSDRNGLPLGTLLSQSQDHTAVVPLNAISEDFIQAIIAAEDGRFYDHGPIDWVAVGRAGLEAIEARQIMSGASTLTMQLARMVDPTPPSVTGKFQEIWLSWRMGAGMTRDEILHAYVNRLPMGGNLYGVEAAAQAYFGSSAKNLNLAQASLLAAIPNDPNRLNPHEHWSALKKRQRYVLEQMTEDGYITPEQSRHILAEKVTLLPRQQGILAAPHFLFWVASQLPDNRPAQVRTTLDLSLQQYVQAQVRAIVKNLSQRQVTQASALVIDNHSGEVLAYVGSTDYFDPTHQGRNDGIQALRQPGSTLKPFLYELALEKGLLRPNSILADVPTSYAIPGGRLYQPLDYHEKFLGPVRVRVALANSLNVPAVRLLEQVTVADFLERLHQLKFTHLKDDPEFYGLGLALGSGEVTLWELAQSYMALASQGKLLPLQVLKASASTPDSNQSENIEANLAEIGQSTNWAFITDVLSDRFARAQAFGVDSVLALPFPAAVKTGTSSDYRDTWTVGFTRDYTVATWVGNFDGSSMKNVSGVMGAAPLWNRIMLHLHEDKEPAPFSPPEGWVRSPICAISGYKPTSACATVVQEYLSAADLATYEQVSDPFFESVDGSGEPTQARLKLPPEYNGWLAKHPETQTNGLKIVSPQSGDRYVVSQDQRSVGNPRDQASGNSDVSTVSRYRQTLEFRVIGYSEPSVQWWVNDRLLDGQSGTSLFWPLQAGDWTVKVVSGDQFDQVEFKVLEAQEQSPQKGFSIGASE